MKQSSEVNILRATVEQNACVRKKHQRKRIQTLLNVLIEVETLNFHKSHFKALLA